MIFLDSTYNYLQNATRNISVACFGQKFSNFNKKEPEISHCASPVYVYAAWLLVKVYFPFEPGANSSQHVLATWLWPSPVFYRFYFTPRAIVSLARIGRLRSTRDQYPLLLSVKREAPRLDTQWSSAVTCARKFSWVSHPWRCTTP